MSVFLFMLDHVHAWSFWQYLWSLDGDCFGC